MKREDTLKEAARLAAESVAAARMSQSFDFTTVPEIERALAPELMIRGSGYTAVFSAKATELLTKASTERHLGPHAPHLALGRDAANPDDLIATPAASAGPDTLPVSWSNPKAPAVNLRKLFALRPFNVAPSQQAHVPVSVDEVEGAGAALVFHLGKTYLTDASKRRTT
ncbi:MAG: hypothetical protein ACM3XM_05215 [Mycobacterium leprae]